MILRLVKSFKLSRILIQQIIQIIIVPSTFPPLHRNLFHLLLLLAQCIQNILQLRLGHAISKLAGAGHHDKSVLHIFRARGFDESDAAESVCSVGFEDLREDGCAGFGFSASVLGNGC